MTDKTIAYGLEAKERQAKNEVLRDERRLETNAAMRERFERTVIEVREALDRNFPDLDIKHQEIINAIRESINNQ